MTSSIRLSWIVAVAALTCLIWSSPAWAPGSLGLDEVLKAVKGSPKLAAEINAELKKDGLKAEDVICIGARFGRHWEYLGGMRAAPYECKIGKREITIEADQALFDAKGKPLGDVNDADPARAKTLRETNFRWKWK